MNRTKHVDMSPEAIDRRLRDLAQLYRLGMEIRHARWLGKISNLNQPRPVKTDDRDEPPSQTGEVPH